MEESTQPGERERGRDGGREMRHKIGREKQTALIGKRK